MESHQLTQSFVSLGLTLLTAGMLSPADHLPEDFDSEPWSSFRPRLQPKCHPHGLLGSPRVALPGQHRPQMCAQKERTLWAGHFMTQMERALQGTRSCLGCRGSGADQKRGQMGPSLRTRPEETLV